jgi:hypothetical protein
VIDDRRTDDERARTAYLVVATDRFMSGWGKAPGRSLFAVPCDCLSQAKIVAANMHNRSEMKRVRIVYAKTYRPRLSAGDHFSIRSMSDSSRFYAPGGF